MTTLTTTRQNLSALPLGVLVELGNTGRLGATASSPSSFLPSARTACVTTGAFVPPGAFRASQLPQ